MATVTVIYSEIGIVTEVKIEWENEELFIRSQFSNATVEFERADKIIRALIGYKCRADALRDEVSRLKFPDQSGS